MGNAVSMSKTPQAKDDVAAASEDIALVIDVLANDLGGKAKALYSLDQNNPLNVATTAHSQFGAAISIVGGKIVYDPTGSAQLQALADGQTVVDTFSYAIRLGNGTLSIATVRVTVGGAAEPVVNHSPVVAAAIADRFFAEDQAFNFSLPANTFADPDHDGLTYTATLADGASLPSWVHFDALSQTFSGTPEQDFNGDFDIRVTGSDGTASVFDDFHLTITPVNDQPVITDVAFDVEHPVFDEQAGTASVNGTASFTDADLTDLHIVSVVPGSATGYVGTFSASVQSDSDDGATGVVGLNFVVNVSDVQGLPPGPHPQTYTITVNDGHGGTASTVVTIPFGDDGGGGGEQNHAPVISIVPGGTDSAFTVVTDNATVGVHFRQRTLSFSDQDPQDSHFVNAVGNSGPSGTRGQLFVNVNPDSTGSGTGGVITWQYQVNEQGSVQALGAGETHFDKFDVMLNDNHGGFAMQTVTVRIDGANDAPKVQNLLTDTNVLVTGAFGDTGGPVHLQFAQTIGYSDLDLNDQHTVTWTPDPVHSTVAPNGVFNIVELHDTLNGLGGLLQWTYDLADSSMPRLPGHENEQRKLTYNVTIDDGHGGVTVPFVIAFNSAPAIQGTPLLSHIEFGESPNTPVWNFADNIAFTDVDPSDHHIVSWEFDQGHSSPGVTAPIGDLSLTFTDTTNGTGGLAHWEYHIDQSELEPMTAGDTRVEAFTFTINDGHGGIASHHLTVTIHGSDPPGFHMA